MKRSAVGQSCGQSRRANSLAAVWAVSCFRDAIGRALRMRDGASGTNTPGWNKRIERRTAVDPARRYLSAIPCVFTVGLWLSRARDRKQKYRANLTPKNSAVLPQLKVPRRPRANARVWPPPPGAVWGALRRGTHRTTRRECGTGTAATRGVLTGRQASRLSWLDTFVVFLRVPEVVPNGASARGAAARAVPLHSGRRRFVHRCGRGRRRVLRKRFVRRGFHG